MGERLIFDTDSDPGMQVVVADGGLSFSNQDDWCGSTESGFGATVSVTLTPAQVAVLHASLGRWLVVQNETPLDAGMRVSAGENAPVVDSADAAERLAWVKSQYHPNR